MTTMSDIAARGHLGLDKVIELLKESGLTVVDSGPVGVRDLHFTVATAAG